jgi:hypothetical protein
MTAKETAHARPTKRFFVEMITRDIELRDAILDLLDNCIDGILRQEKQSGKSKAINDKPYRGYWAKISLSSKKFVISDNCGGIPREVAVNSAFMLGRPNSSKDEGIATVGMYGIGMKRAIFKFGKEAVVKSRTSKDAYEVRIPETWLGDDLDWELPLKDVTKGLEQQGTEIVVEKLHDSISDAFEPKNKAFLDTFRKDVSQIYAIILEKGFRVEINEEVVLPRRLTLLNAKSLSTTKSGIRPYIFKGTLDKVDVTIACGFYRKMPSVEEVEEEKESPKIPHTAEAAGWTIICNDRVVMYADKSHRTGWGTGTVPRFHNQFIAIGGIVIFHSKNPTLLPLNTTKRGIEMQSHVYALTLDLMREAVKVFTNFTNDWKSQPNLISATFKETDQLSVEEISKSIKKSEWKPVKKLSIYGGGKRHIPELPKPASPQKFIRITIMREPAEIQELGKYLFGNSRANANEVATECMERVLKISRKQ